MFLRPFSNKQNNHPLAITRWETTLYEPVFRKLVNESVSTFLSLQKLAEDEAVGGEGVHPVHICQWERFIAKLLLVRLPLHLIVKC